MTDNLLDSVGHQDVGDILASLGVLSLGEEQHLGVVTQLVLRGAWRWQMWPEGGIACWPPDLAADITATTENRLRRTVPNQAGTQDKAAALSVSIQSPANYSTAPQPYNPLTSPAYSTTNQTPFHRPIPQSSLQTYYSPSPLQLSTTQVPLQHSIYHSPLHYYNNTITLQHFATQSPIHFIPPISTYEDKNFATDQRQQ